MKIHFRSHLNFFLDEEEWGRKDEDYETKWEKKSEKMQVKSVGADGANPQPSPILCSISKLCCYCIRLTKN